jgi:hypothetical protein
MFASRFRTTFWFFLCLVLIQPQLRAQMRVGQSAAPPDGSAALDVSGGPYKTGSPYRGIVPPKVALVQTTQPGPITSPTLGLLVYNTATAGDVKPGYFYWEGTKWVRFSTTSSGAGRIAAGNGQSIPAYLLGEVITITSPPDHIILVEPGREGLFRYVQGDATPADGGMILATSNGRYRRVYNGSVSVEKWGVIVGTNVSGSVRSANTAALQKAADSGLSLFFPEGIIETNGTITVTDKAVNWYGSGQTSVIRQTTDVDLFVIDNSAGNYAPTIQGMCFQAGAKFTTATALTLKGIPDQDPVNIIQSKPFGHLSQLYFWGKDTYVVPGWTTEWKKNIVITSPNTITLNDIQIQGASSTKANATVGIEMTANRASIETMIHNVKIDVVTTGLAATSTIYPGIEGLHISHCTMAGVYDGIVIASSAYLAPLWLITDCHVAAARTNISLFNGSQGRITNCLLYNTGMAESGDFSSFMALAQCSQFDITNNRCYGISGDPYGIIGSAAGPQNQSSYNSIIGNYFRLNPASDHPAIWLQTPWEYGTIQGNYKEVGGGPTVLSINSLSHDNRINDNFPADAVDGSETLTLTPVDVNDATKGKLLDLRSTRASYIIIPASQAGTISQIRMQLGQRVSVGFDGPVTVKHDLSQIRLAGAADHLFMSGDVLNLIYTGLRVEETSRKENINDLLTATLSYNLNTTSWTPSNYTTIVPPGVLANNKVYLVKLYYEQPGNTAIVQSYTLPIVNTYTGSVGSSNPIVGNSISYNNDGKQFNLRYKPGPGTMGLEIAPNTSGMAGTLIVTIAPLL